MANQHTKAKETDQAAGDGSFVDTESKVIHVEPKAEMVSMTKEEFAAALAKAATVAADQAVKNVTVHHQTEEPVIRRKKFKFDPNRHYCWMELPNKDWDSDAIDNLLDEIDPDTGEQAYRVEADGSTDVGRAITGSRRKIWVSCSAAYARRVQDQNSNASQERARQISHGETKHDERSEMTGNSIEMVETETLLYKKPVPLKGIIGA